MEVYVDLLFILELLMNGLALLVSGLICGVKPRPLRVLAAAAVSAAVTCAMVLLPVPTWCGRLFGVFALLFAVYVAYGRKRSFLKLALTACIATLCFGGALSALFYDAFTFSPLIFIVGTALSFAALMGFKRLIAIREANMRQICAITIESDGETARCTGLVDTGNALADPFTQTPVVVASRKAVASLLPAALSTFSKRVRVIPYRTVGADYGGMLAFRPDRTVIETDDGAIEVKAIIGVYDRDIEGGFDALINPQLLIRRAT